MSRQDIHVDAVLGEVNVTGNLTNKVIYDFELLPDIEGLDNDRFCYGEIQVPAGFERRYKDKTGIHTRINYFPFFKQLQIRFRILNENGSSEYLINKTNNKTWFPVFKETEAGNYPVRLSEYMELNENGFFNFIMRDGYLAVFSGDETDFVIKAALGQNETFLLKAFAGNLYQFPTTGVGLIDFLHGNFENTGLAAKLQQEFENDNMVIHNAYMDSNTGELILEVSEKNG